jgi:hypothetical protein
VAGQRNCAVIGHMTRKGMQSLGGERRASSSGGWCLVVEDSF